MDIRISGLPPDMRFEQSEARPTPTGVTFGEVLAQVGSALTTAAQVGLSVLPGAGLLGPGLGAGVGSLSTGLPGMGMPSAGIGAVSGLGAAPRPASASGPTLLGPDVNSPTADPSALPPRARDARSEAPSDADRPFPSARG
jgi:hypothetical protein